MSALPPKADIRGEALLITAVKGRLEIPHRASSFSSSEARSSAVRIFAGALLMTDQLRATWAAGDRVGALRIAARFFDRSENTRAFKRGIDAFNHPDFYTQLGKEPQELVRVALEVLAKRFDLP